jgi:hypothetical protein
MSAKRLRIDREKPGKRCKAKRRNLSKAKEKAERKAKGESSRQLLYPLIT